MNDERLEAMFAERAALEPEDVAAMWGGSTMPKTTLSLPTQVFAPREQPTRLSLKTHSEIVKAKKSLTC